MIELVTIFSILLITLIGFTAIQIFHLFEKHGVPEALLLGFGLGCGLVSGQLFLYSVFHVSWSIPALLLPWIAFFIYPLFRRSEKFTLKFSHKQKYTTIQKILIVLVFSLLIYVFFEAQLRTVSAWDAWSIWLLKAKVFYVDGFINPRIFNYLESDYPLVISLSLTFMAKMIGSFNDRVLLLLSFAYYAAESGLLFIALKKRIGLTKALVATFLFMSLQNIVRHGGRFEAGQADLPLGYFMLCDVLLIFEYIRKPNVKILALLTAFLAITTQVKHEGIVFAFIVEIAIFYFALKKKKYKHLLSGLFVVCPVIGWQIFVGSGSFHYSYFSGHHTILSIHKAWNSIIGFMKEFLNIKNWNLLWVAFFGVLLASLRCLKPEQKLLLYFIFSQFFVYFLLYCFTTGNDPQSSIDRLFIHVCALAILFITQGIFQEKGVK
ncbi:MAG TPA: hypothetical protein VLF68_01840 [Candidatus Saccharimonadales bacterium]|nr:hypothetical protein [Candidatus Saccharimonadales bacterium]